MMKSSSGNGSWNECNETESTNNNHGKCIKLHVQEHTEETELVFRQSFDNPTKMKLLTLIKMFDNFERITFKLSSDLTRTQRFLPIVPVILRCSASYSALDPLISVSWRIQLFSSCLSGGSYLKREYLNAC